MQEISRNNSLISNNGNVSNADFNSNNSNKDNKLTAPKERFSKADANNILNSHITSDLIKESSSCFIEFGKKILNKEVDIKSSDFEEEIIDTSSPKVNKNSGKQISGESQIKNAIFPDPSVKRAERATFNKNALKITITNISNNPLIIDSDEQPNSDIPQLDSYNSDGQSPNIQNFLIKPLQDYLGSVPEDEYEAKKAYIEKALHYAFETKSLQKNINIEKSILSLAPNTPLPSDARERILTGLAEKIIQLTKEELSDDTLRLSLETTDFDISSVKDMLEIIRRTVVQLLIDLNTLPDEKEINVSSLKQLCQAIINNHAPKPEAALADAQKTLKDIRTLLGNYKKNHTELSQKTIDFIADYKQLAGYLDTQIKATARQSIKQKLRAAQSERIRLAWETGRSQACELSIDIGYEWAILGRLGIYFNPKFNYAIDVHFPRGRIAVSHSFALGVNVKGTLGPVNAGIGGHYNKGKVHYYNSPEELVEAESNRMYKSLMHLAKPLEIPQNSAPTFTGALARFWNSIKNIGTQIKHLFSSESEETVIRHALAENMVFKNKLSQHGILGQFDELKRDSFNRRLGDKKISNAKDVSLSAQKKKGVDLGILKKLQGNFTAKWTNTTTKAYVPLLTDLGDSPYKLENFLRSEYQNVEKTSYGTIGKEHNQICNALYKERFPSLSVLEKEISELSNDFLTFCDLTAKDDYAKWRINPFKNHSPMRHTMMTLRDAKDRGDYFRSLMVRCAALKYMLLKTSGKKSNNDANSLSLSSDNNLINNNPENNLSKAGNEPLEKDVDTLLWKLEKLSKSLEKPPVVLSKGNLTKMHSFQKYESKDTTLNLGFKVSLPSPPSPPVQLGPLFDSKKDSTFDINVQGSLVIPDAKTKFYGNHNRGTLTFSVTGDKLLQYSPQFLTYAIQGIVNANKNKDINGINVAGKSLADFVKDIGTDMAHDLATSNINSLVTSAIENNTGFKPSGDEIDISLKTLDFSVAHKNTFTFSISFISDGKQSRYGGISVSNSRNLTADLDLHAPIGPGSIGLTVNAGVSVTDSVVTTLGTDTFGSLIQELPDIRTNQQCKSDYVNYHSGALLEMFNKCTFHEDTKLKNELNSFMRHLNNQCIAQKNYLNNLNANDKKFSETLGRLERLCDSSIQFLKAHKEVMKLARNNAPDNIRNDLCTNIKNLLTAVKKKSLGLDEQSAQRLAQKDMGEELTDLEKNPQDMNPIIVPDSAKCSAIMTMADYMQRIDNNL